MRISYGCVLALALAGCASGPQRPITEAERARQAAFQMQMLQHQHELQLQQMKNNAALYAPRPAPTYQPMPMPQPVRPPQRCTSQWIGGQLQTVCY